MKNYSDEVINNIQKIININNFELTQIRSFNDLPHEIYLGGVKLQLLDKNGRHDTIFYEDFSFDRENIKEWKKEPIGRFYNKDWKYKNKGENRFHLYYILNLFVDDVEVTALIRIIDQSEFNDEEDFKYIKSLEINGKNYTIIKAFSPTINETFRTKSTLEEWFQPKIMDMYGIIINDEYNGKELNDISDENNSIELF